MFMLSACGLLPQKGSRVARDDYFARVHAEQVAAAGWPDEKRATRKSIAATLELTPDAADVSIAQATHERAEVATKDSGGTRLDVIGEDAHAIAVSGAKDDAALSRAVEESAKSELRRAKKLKSLEVKVAELADEGHALIGYIESNVPSPTKRTQIQAEINASFHALDDLGRAAKREAREAEDYVADLQRAFRTGIESGARQERPNVVVVRRPKPKPAPPGQSHPAAPPGEVFTP
jgi:hypothetical protein